MKSIAYKGQIGRRREAFCLQQIRLKRHIISQIEKTLAASESQTGAEVSCTKGCSACCSMYIEASIQECEAIVYYLYHHDGALAAFLQAYPAWRSALRQRGDIFKGRNRFWEPPADAASAVTLWQEFAQAEDRYFEQGIPCPFLSSDECTIYEVRPYVCASYAVCSPPEFCRPRSSGRPRVIKAIPHGVRTDRSFYHPPQLPEYVLSTMQIMVYEILKSGPTCFAAAGIKGLEDLDSVWLADPEVSLIYMRYLQG